MTRPVGWYPHPFRVGERAHWDGKKWNPPIEPPEGMSAKEALAEVNSPFGRAAAAAAEGARFLHLEMDTLYLNGPQDVLGQIESMGWHLEHVSHVFAPVFSGQARIGNVGDGLVTNGHVVGVYLFRRVG